MPTTREEIDAFRQFAESKLSNGGAALTLEELLAEWRTSNRAPEVHAAIRQALAEMQAGEGQPLEEALEDIRT